MAVRAAPEDSFTCPVDRARRIVEPTKEEKLSGLLFQAVQKRDLAAIDRLLTDGVSDSQRSYVAYKAAEFGYFDILRACLNDGAISKTYQELAITRLREKNREDMVQEVIDNAHRYISNS